MNIKANVKEEQFITEWSFEFMELLDDVKDETSANYNNIDGLFEFGGYIIWFSTERKISFENYVKLVNIFATITSDQLGMSYNKTLNAILNETLNFGESR